MRCAVHTWVCLKHRHLRVGEADDRAREALLRGMYVLVGDAKNPNEETRISEFDATCKFRVEECIKRFSGCIFWDTADQRDCEWTE